MLITVLFALSAAGLGGGMSPLLSSGFIFTNAPFPSCHASTVVQTPSGKIFTAFFGGTAEGNPDVDIYLSEFNNGIWRAPVAVADGLTSSGQRLPCYNPVLFQPKNGPLILFYKVGSEPQKWVGYMKCSADEGRTWSLPKRLPDGFLGPIKNKPLELPDGTIICPSSTEAGGCRIHFETTKDFGKTFKKTNDLNDPNVVGAIQPSILFLGPNHLRAVGRTQQKKIFSIDSLDSGKTWGSMSLLDVPNPNSGIDAVTLKDGRHLMVYNPSTSKRTPLTVAESDDATHWRDFLTLERDPGEYSYPAIIQLNDGRVLISYTWRRERIKYAVLDPKRIR